MQFVDSNPLVQHVHLDLPKDYTFSYNDLFETYLGRIYNNVLAALSRDVCYPGSSTLVCVRMASA